MPIEILMEAGMSTNRDLKGKIYDPVFVCMLIAIVLAVGSSVLLRTMSRGPKAAHAADMPADKHHNIDNLQRDE